MRGLRRMQGGMRVMLCGAGGGGEGRGGFSTGKKQSPCTIVCPLRKKRKMFSYCTEGVRQRMHQGNLCMLVRRWPCGMLTHKKAGHVQ